MLFLIRSKVVFDVEHLSDLLWCLALDHVGNRLASQIKQRLDVQKVCTLKVHQ